MPGIVGIFSSDQLSTEGEQSFRGMCESLRHLATQHPVSWQYERLLVGGVDLGILPESIRPRETAEVIAFMWGELLTPQAERRKLLECVGHEQGELDDVEFLIGLFAKYRHRFASHLRGSFNAFIVDKQRRALIIANDRLGFRPLYYAVCGNELIFASEVKAILRYRRFTKVVNDAGVADFFHFGFVTGNKTFFHGIEILPPRTCLRYEHQEIRLKQYWNLTFTDDRTAAGINESKHTHELADAIRESVKASTEGGFRFGLPLSGGLDSRAIAACIPRDRYPVLIYTWGMPDSLEVQTAKKIADTLGLAHHNVHRTPEEFVDNFEKAVIMTDGMIPANLPLGNFLYERAFAPSVDICLDGMQSISVVNPISVKPLTNDNVVDRITLGSIAETLKTVLARPYQKIFYDMAMLSREQLRQSISSLDPINGYQVLDITQKQRRLDNFGVLVKRNFVEVRSPLFDYPIIDVIQRIPPSLRKHRYIYYKAFTHLSPELAKIPNVATMVPISAPHWLQIGGRITKSLKPRIYSKVAGKLGLNYDRHKLCDWGIDYAYWYSESLTIRKFMNQVLASENIRNCEYLNTTGVKEILDAHLSATVNHTRTLNRLMTYAVWSKNFL